MSDEKKIVPSEEGGVIKKVKKTKKGETPSPDSSNTKYEYILKNKKSRKEVKHKKFITIVSFVIIFLLLGIGLFYGMYTAIKVNSFKVFIDSSGSKVLSLSSDREFSFGSEVLQIKGPGTMDNTTLALGMNLVTSPTIEERLATIVTSDGFEAGATDRFIASTFYLKNTTANVQTYVEELNLRNASNRVETAMRVMLIRNHKIMVYAKANNGVPEQVVPLSTPYTELFIEENEDGTVNILHKGEEAWIAEDFHNDDYIFYNENLNIQPGEIIKYSIVIWLEGWDPDCTDDKLKGIIQMDFAFSQRVPSK